jgi:hypothetical protein
MKLWKEWEKGDRDYLHTPMERVKLDDIDGKCVCEPKTTSARARLMKHHGFQEYVEAPQAEPMVEAPVAEEKPKKKAKSKRLEEVAKAAVEAGE